MRVPSYWREAALALALLAPLAMIFAGVPIAQDPQYHAFADERSYWGLPNFLNVASNVPFLLVGVAGLWTVVAKPAIGASRSWAVFFIGTALVCLGSGYYHWAPDSKTLIWDRLPMTTAFMALFAAFVSEHVGARCERALLAAALAIGIASAVWWHYADDLRLYIWVQLTPFLAILIVPFIFPGRYTHRAYLLYGLAFYVLAKITEAYDREIFALTVQTVSGHSVKHLLAAVAAFFVYLMLRRRAALTTRQ